MSAGPHRSVVVVFAREPVAGNVKTRLAARVGDAAALALYRAFLTDLLAQLRAGSWALEFAVAGDPQRFAETFGIDPDGCFRQAEGDLGARMDKAFHRILADEDRDRCLLVGSDMPQLGASGVALADAALAMGEADVVLGPAHDGGYYLVGMARPHPIFSEIAWSTDRVLAQTRSRTRHLGLRTTLLPEGFDIDTAEDLERLARWLEERDDGVLPHTRAVCRELFGPAGA